MTVIIKCWIFLFPCCDWRPCKKQFGDDGFYFALWLWEVNSSSRQLRNGGESMWWPCHHIMLSVTKQREDGRGTGLYGSLQLYTSFSKAMPPMSPCLLKQHHHLETKCWWVSGDISNPSLILLMNCRISLDPSLLDFSFMENMDILMPRISVRFN